MILETEKEIDSIILNESLELLSELDLDLRKHLDFFRIGDADSQPTRKKQPSLLNYKQFICKYLSLSKGQVDTDKMKAELERFPPNAQEKILNLYMRLSGDDERAREYCLGAKKEIQSKQTALAAMKKQAEQDKEKLIALAKEEPRALLTGIGRQLATLGVERGQLQQVIQDVLPPEVWRIATQFYTSQKRLGPRARALPAAQLAESQKKRFKKLAGII